MKYIPIVAVVSEDVFHALNDHISSTPEPTPEWQAVMQRNGWTIDSIVAGVVLGQAFDLPTSYPSVTEGP